MQVRSVTITSFRNFEALTQQFAPGVNVFFGANGSGKTNLLEAIYALCLGRSQRGVADTVLLRDGAEVYRLAGELTTDSRSTHVAVAYQKGGRRKITIDEVPVRPAELFERFCAVAAGPEDSAILSGAPSQRRLFLDLHLSQHSQTYLKELVAYQRALAQKNAALKGRMDASLFDDQLIDYGSAITLRRAAFVRELREASRPYYRDISQGEAFDMQYSPELETDPECDDIAIIKAAFVEQLERNRDREMYQKTAVVGPHRDDLAISIAGFPARTHGSQGQWRTAAVALKLAIYRMLTDKRRMAPLLVLDEIFAELDDYRTSALISGFSGFEQLFLTTAVEPPEPLRTNATRFKITAGRVERIG
ncbi:MAG: DNA replication/repair protein RecF [candidate division Zixibacteria bacterium]|nr:DNA replication/repair protein RecF [candidate division Zixibacteria bacterium]